jgi:hypothetical protein
LPRKIPVFSRIRRRCGCKILKTGNLRTNFLLSVTYGGAECDSTQEKRAVETTKAGIRAGFLSFCIYFIKRAKTKMPLFEKIYLARMEEFSRGIALRRVLTSLEQKGGSRAVS